MSGDLTYFTTWIRLERVALQYWHRSINTASPQLFLWYSIVDGLEHLVLLFCNLFVGPHLVPRTKSKAFTSAAGSWQSRCQLNEPAETMPFVSSNSGKIEYVCMLTTPHYSLYSIRSSDKLKGPDAALTAVYRAYM